MNTTPKVAKRRVNGVLLLDKAQGISSNRALQQVRHLYRAQKAGHTGILDPLATGLLPICLGEASKFAQYLLNADKAYLATLKLGEATSTGDAEGEVIEIKDLIIKQNDFQQACQGFIGQSKQTPPMYSALKHEGKPLYEYARQGINIERPAREVKIERIELLDFQYPFAQIFVACSKGTYIRTLAEDIAKTCHTVAHLTALRRTQTAGFRIEQSHSFDDLAQLTEKQRDDLLLPCDAFLQHFPEISLPNDDIMRLQQGQSVHFSESCGIIPPFRLYDEEKRFIGLVKIEAENTLKALRLMNTGSQAS